MRPGSQGGRLGLGAGSRARHQRGVSDCGDRVGGLELEHLGTRGRRKAGLGSYALGCQGAGWDSGNGVGLAQELGECLAQSGVSTWGRGLCGQGHPRQAAGGGTGGAKGMSEQGQVAPCSRPGRDRQAPSGGPGPSELGGGSCQSGGWAVMAELDLRHQNSAASLVPPHLAWGSKLHHLRAEPHLTPTGTRAVTTGSELLSQLPRLAGSPWETLAVSPVGLRGGLRVGVPGCSVLLEGPSLTLHVDALLWRKAHEQLRKGTGPPPRQGRVHPLLSHLQVTPNYRVTSCRWQPPTTTSLPWCTSRKFLRTGSTSRSPSTVGPHPVPPRPRPWSRRGAGDRIPLVHKVFSSSNTPRGEVFL